MNSNNGGLQYAVDIVMCIDATGSMHATLDHVKDSALSFHTRLSKGMHDKGKAISQLRVRVIAFRDFGDRPDDAIEATDFLTLPEQAAEFDRFVHGLHATGGGDEPESGLEALALAVQSPWERGLDRRRHIIVVFTDASAHPLGSPDQLRARGYPQAVPRSMDRLFEIWGPSQEAVVMDNSAKRLLLYAPEVSPWEEIADDWNNTLYFPSEAGQGLEEYEMDEIIETIVNSL